MYNSDFNLLEVYILNKDSHCFLIYSYMHHGQIVLNIIFKDDFSIFIKIFIILCEYIYCINFRPTSTSK